MTDFPQNPGERAKEILLRGRNVLDLESRALSHAAKTLDEKFALAVETMLACRGKIVVTGLGKSGHVGRKIAATLSSTGTAAFFLHPAEALHGDFGTIQGSDVLLALAFGGETREVLEVVRFCKSLNIPTLAITGRPDSTLAQKVDCYLDASIEKEACPFDLAPSVSSTLCLALGDSLALTIMQLRNFTQKDFARLHPAGSLGMRLAKVGDIMRPVSQLALIKPDTDFHGVLYAVTRNNFGIAAVMDDHGKLAGAVTDGDLRRALLGNTERALKFQASQLMSVHPRTISSSALAIDSVVAMEEYKCTSLFVVDEQAGGSLCGLIRMHDLLDAKII